MAKKQGPLNELIPEIYPIIAAHLPLYVTPSTLLALALTNHHISKIALPLVYSRVLLKDELNATLVLQKLVDNPPVGLMIRELHIMSDLSVETRNQNPPSDVIRRVEDVISKGYLPFIHTLGLHLTKRWYYDPDKDYEPVNGFGQLRKDFCAQLKEKCPRLRGLILKGFSDDLDEPWVEESGFLQVPDITNLSIHFNGFTIQKSASDKLFQHISSLAPSLHTLDLNPGSTQSSSTSLIFELDLPCLRFLSLSSFSEVEPVKAMTFFERHPSIEYLDVTSNLLDANSCWFLSNLPENFLPNLRHLRAHWNEVRLLAPILDQLFSLSINRSINAQIPYLLRFILPNGLPNLKSLDIGQSPSSSRKNKTIEGGLWFESDDGTFNVAKTKKQSITVFDSFMHSIVRAAPNLEELGFHGDRFPLPDFFSIANDLNGFLRLKRLYYDEYHSGLGAFERNIFASQASDLAEAVPGLTSITNVSSLYLPYLTAKVSRGESGELIGVEVGRGYGMEIGYDDEAFPLAPEE